MNSIFARRRSRLLAMKALRDDALRGGREAALTCPSCGRETPRRLVVQALHVCPACGYHWPIGGYYRLSTLLDPGSFRELNEKYPAGDPLHFPGYPEKLSAAQRRTGLTEAAVTATGTIGGVKCVVGVLDSRFLMGSMSAAVGEKLTLAIEYAPGSTAKASPSSAPGRARPWRKTSSATSACPIRRAIARPCG